MVESTELSEGAPKWAIRSFAGKEGVDICRLALVVRRLNPSN